ncbi:putative disease resistance RPP13-like protein 1 [Manihot esculenta]|uniref:putative disease resistance RPP13-like protein 1 n=1 Tax=Manihot esculenta TaxID=3983 RepID=UPI000B5D863F|nr:putative disease resistance RPP13-like protein 1 [Manihot esculenta]
MEFALAAAGSILSVCFQGLLDRLNSIDLMKYVGQGQVLAQLMKWEKILKRIYAVLEDAEEKQTANRLVQIWLSDLRDLAYDLEDIIDELATEVQQRKLEDEPVHPKNKVHKFFCVMCGGGNLNLNTIKFNVEMVAKIEETSARLDEIIKQKDELRLAEYTTRRVSHVTERPPATSLVNEAKVYGREEDKKAMLKLLNAETSDAQVSVISIVGMGGLGKTTLAQLVYNDPMLEFDLKAWVSVGEDFDVSRVTKTFLLQLGDGGDDKDLNVLQVKLKQKLSGNKFLVVLDDVWTQNYEEWTLFWGPFEAGAPQSRVIVTTRSQDVSLMMGTTQAYALKKLSHNECMSVFAQHALGANNFDAHLELKQMGEEIVKRCGGLPLAAKALGGILRGKPNPDLWKEVLRNEIWELPDDKSNILPALRVSYLHLPPHLKRCFSYCAILPKDREFDRNELVLLWMAEGFLYDKKKMKDSEDLGRKYFDDLLSRSFFQQSIDDKSKYLMHDLIIELACYVSGETCLHMVDKLESTKPYAKIRHSSFIPHYTDTAQRFQSFYGMKNLRTFLSMRKDWIRCYITSKVVHELVPKLKCLRSLSLAGYYIEGLPNSIGDLKHLRYLNLSRTPIRRLPESVDKLFNLQTLILRDCDELIELPKGICNLLNLQHLDIIGTRKLKEMPPHIGNLTSLCVLTKFIVGKSNGRITELKKLCDLRGQLHITSLENVEVEDIRDAGFANLKDNPGITELHLEWAEADEHFDDSRKSSHEEQVLDSIQPHQSLLRLSITSFGGRKFPSWIGERSFSGMVQVELWKCRQMTSLPPLGRLKSLKKLSIGDMSGMKEVGVEFYEDDSCFSCLEELEIRSMGEWELWAWSNGLVEDSVPKFPKLHHLQIRNCPKLVGKLPTSLPSLENLFIVDCPLLVELPKVLPSLTRLHFAKCKIRSVTNATSLTRLKYLEIKLCDALVSLVDGEPGLLPCNLEVLKIFECPNLKELPSGLKDLKSLKYLSIRECRSLVSFPTRGLPHNMISLLISSCESLESMSEGIVCPSNYSGETSHLEELYISGCESLRCSSNGKFPYSLKTLRIHNWTPQFLNSLYCGLSHLTELHIVECPQLESFPGKELPLPSLISLTIAHCEGLRSLSNHMQDFQSLQKLEIWNCHQLELFPKMGLPNPNLVSFQISWCKNLRSLPNQMQNLTSLQSIDISECEGMETLGEGCLPPNLTSLHIRQCLNMKQPMLEWGLHRLASLRSLALDGDSTGDIISFPDNDGFLLPTALTYLYIIRFENLKSISRGIQKLTSLKTLSIWRCPKLQSFPAEGLPATLEGLSIHSCPLLLDRCLKDKGGDYWPIISDIPCVAVPPS